MVPMGQQTVLALVCYKYASARPCCAEEAPIYSNYALRIRYSGEWNRVRTGTNNVLFALCALMRIRLLDQLPENRRANMAAAI